jgi:CRP-like cAMP-binding protein
MPALAPAPPLQAASDNRLLAAMPEDTRALLAGALQRVPMRLGEMLYEPGTKMRHAWFPTTAVVSLHQVTAAGESAEAAGVGCEGMVGIALFTGGESMPSSAVVHSAGWGYRVEGAALANAFASDASLRRVLLLYTQALMVQIAQTAACYRHHTVEQQLSRWLLQTVARVPAGEFVMTQELVASLLGVRRESITQAAGVLQAGGYIRYRRGHITVLDAAGLHSRACECHGVVTAEMQRLLGA